MTEPAIPPPPPPPPPALPELACAECGANLDESQEICVECGHAVGARGRRRIRGAMPTASLAAFAVLLGASAAYGLSAGGASNVKDLGVGAKPPASNTIAQATPTTPPPATTSSSPDTVPQATPTPPPSSSSTSSTPSSSPKPSKKAKAAKPATPSSTPSTPSSTPSTPSSTPSTPSHHHHTTHQHHTTTPTGPPSWFADADPPYDAFSYGGGSGAKKAIDGSTKTAWTTSSSGTGVIVDTGQAQPYSAVGIATSTPGFAVTIYSSNNKTASGNPSANGWKRVGHASSVGQYQQVGIKSPNNPPRYLLIYVTKLPSGGKTRVNEVKLVL